MTRLLPLIALVLAMAAAVACGGSSTSGAATATPQSSGAAAQPSGVASAASTSPASNSSPGSGQVTGSGASALKKLSTDLSGKTYQVSYDINIVPASGSATKGSMTLSQKPPKTATSIQLTAGSTETIIDDGTYTYICSSTSAGGGQCAKSKTGSTPNPIAAGFSLDSFLKNLSENVDVTTAGNQNIAGVDSQCFTIKGATGENGTACFSKADGLVTLLDSKSQDGSTNHIQASKVSTNVADSVFAPPPGYTTVDSTTGQ